MTEGGVLFGRKTSFGRGSVVWEENVMSEGGVLYGRKMCRKGECCTGGRCHVGRVRVVWEEDVM